MQVLSCIKFIHWHLLTAGLVVGSANLGI